MLVHPEIGFLIIVYHLSSIGAIWLFRLLFHGLTIAPNLQLPIYWRLSYGITTRYMAGIFFGLIVLVIAHVFRESVRLKEEQKLTV
jgi:hypothetical protein